ncbi:MAG: hypothetical protein HZB38_05060 [Planctomycetes bacterium]|nr:hypothetical protein [Planctomycetota bacterium]
MIRRKPLAAGLILLLIGAPLLIGLGVRRLAAVDWWRWAPTNTVINSAVAGSSGARREFARRLCTEPLDEQTLDRMLAVATNARLSVRKTAVMDEFYPVRLVSVQWVELMFGDRHTRLEIVALRVDGQSPPVDQRGMSMRRPCVVYESPGEHVVEMDVRLHSPAYGREQGASGPIQTLREVVTVLPAGADDVEIVPASAVENLSEDAFAITALPFWTVYSEREWDDARLRVIPPVPLIFRVELERDGKRVWIGDVRFNSKSPWFGEWTRRGDVSGVKQVFGEVPDRCDLILRGDKSAARWTTDITQVLDGEIRIRDVPIISPQPFRP